MKFLLITALLTPLISLADNPTFDRDKEVEKFPEMREQNKEGPPKEVIIQAQEELKKEGYLIGITSGELDSKTERAIKSFQKKNKMEATGVLDELTLRALKVEGPKIQAQEEDKKNHKSSP